MDEKLNILEKVYPIFQNHGAKTVTMNDVSRACGISKKTLYVYFPNKEALLKEIVDLTIEKIQHVLESIENQEFNAIQESLNIINDVYFTLQTNDDVFMYQLNKYYPKIHERCESYIMNEIYNTIFKNLNKGISEGLYRSDIDIDLTTRLLLSNIMTVKTSEIFQPTGKTRKELTYFIIDFYLNSIITEKGKKLFHEIKAENVEN